jgi:spermidine synthase
VFVVDRGNHRYLRFGAADASDDQSMVSLSDPEAVPMDYIRYATIGAAYVTDIKRLLMVGLGGGTFTSMVHRLRPDIHIDVAEINPVVAQIARDYFGVHTDERYRIHIGDGSQFIQRAVEPYDLILVDAYGKDGIPAHLKTSRWFAAVAGKLNGGGVLVANLSTEAATERLIVTRMREALPGVACFRTADTLNLIVVARRDRDMPGRRELLAAADRVHGAWGLPFDLGEAALQLDAGCREVLW